MESPTPVCSASSREGHDVEPYQGTMREKGLFHTREMLRLLGTGKAKPKKHTAKEIALKVDAATTNRGGGKAGLEDRSGAEKGGHAKLACPICKATAPDVKSMQIHHEARHPKLPFDEEKMLNLHASSASAEKGKPGVRGSHKK